MTKQARYASRPCKSLDSPALWDWLESEHPEVMEQFIVTFIREVEKYFGTRIYLWEMLPRHSKLREYIKKFMKYK